MKDYTELLHINESLQEVYDWAFQQHGEICALCACGDTCSSYDIENERTCTDFIHKG